MPKIFHPHQPRFYYVLCPETSTKFNNVIKDRVRYSENTTDVHDKTASTINAGISIKSDDIAI